jgi:hypothetical protein
MKSQFVSRRVHKEVTQVNLSRFYLLLLKRLYVDVCRFVRFISSNRLLIVSQAHFLANICCVMLKKYVTVTSAGYGWQMLSK